MGPYTQLGIALSLGFRVSGLEFRVWALKELLCRDFVAKMFDCFGLNPAPYTLC